MLAYLHGATLGEPHMKHLVTLAALSVCAGLLVPSTPSHAGSATITSRDGSTVSSSTITSRDGSTVSSGTITSRDGSTVSSNASSGNASSVIVDNQSNVSSS